MPPIPPTKKKPVSDFAAAFNAAAGDAIHEPIVENQAKGKSEFALALEEADKKKVGTTDSPDGSTPSAAPTSNSEAPLPSTESTAAIPSTNGYDIATLNGIIKPEGTFKQEPIKPVQDFISQLKGNAKVENGVLTIHDGREVKGGQDLPDIKDAIDATVNNKIKKDRGVELNTPVTQYEKEAATKVVTDAYKRGDLVLAKDGAGKSVLKRGAGFLESFLNGVNQTYLTNQENEHFISLSKEDKIKYLNANTQPNPTYDIQSEAAPSGFGGVVGNFVGENAAMLAKGAIGAMAATAAVPAAVAAGSANFGSFNALAGEFGYGGYRGAWEKTYRSLKQQGLSDEEAADKAENVGLVGAATQTAVGAVLSGSIHAPELKASEPAVNGLIDGIVRSAGDMLKKEAPKMAATSAGGSLVESGAQAAVGVDVDPGKALKEAVEAGGHGAVIAAAFWGLHEPLRLHSYLRPQAANVGASIPVEAREEYLNKAVEQEIITEEQKVKISKTINEFGETKKPLQDLPIPEEKKAAITGKLVQAKKIQEEIDSLTPYGASFNDRIAQLTAQKEEIHADVNKMYGAEDVFSLEKDSLTGESPTAPAVIMPNEVNRPTTEIGITPEGETKTSTNESQVPNQATTAENVEGAKHAETIKTKFRQQFSEKGVSDEHIDGAVALLDARAKSWASEEKGRKPEDWYNQIADIKSGQFESEDVKFQNNQIRNAVISALTLINSDNIKTAVQEIPTWGGTEVIAKAADSYINVKDNRSSDAASSLAVTDRNNLSNKEVSVGVVKDIVRAANKHGVDPYTALAIALQETGIRGYGQSGGNVFHLIDFDPYADNSKKTDNAVKFLKEKLEYAKKLGKTREADAIQAWNGYGKIGKIEGKRSKLYGIDVSKQPIDMSKNPIYGKRIIDVRDNIVKKSPELVKLVESEKGNVLYQNGESGAKGAMETLKDGRVIIHALTKPDFSTMVHEIGHVFEKDLTETEKKVVRDAGGSEVFARGFERYLRDGEAPSKELKTLFGKFKSWLTDIYQSLKGSPIEKRVSTEIKKIFDRLLTEKKEVKSEAPLTRDASTGILHREAPIEIKEEVRNKFQELDNLRNAITEEGANRKERKNAVDKFLQENPHIDAVDRHFSNITKELEAAGHLKKSSADCP